jgi:hypothetical protein
VRNGNVLKKPITELILYFFSVFLFVCQFLSYLDLILYIAVFLLRHGLRILSRFLPSRLNVTKCPRFGFLKNRILIFDEICLGICNFLFLSLSHTHTHTHTHTQTDRQKSG